MDMTIRLEVGCNDGFAMNIGDRLSQSKEAFYSSTERAKARADLLAEVARRFDEAFTKRPEAPMVSLHGGVLTTWPMKP